MSLLAATALRFVNRLLGNEHWAKTRLAPFAGQAARVEFRDWSMTVAVTPEGLFVEAPAGTEALVTLRLPDDTLSRVVSDRASIVGATRISGSIEFAEALGFVARNLRWDVEDDLAQVFGGTTFGDIAARRIVDGARRFGAWQREAMNRGARNLGEYLVFETQAVASREAFSAFCSEVDALGGDLARLEKRLQRIEQARPLQR